SSDPSEVPSCAFELPLSFEVCLILIDAVPAIAIAFHFEPRERALDNHVDAVSANLVLWDDSQPFPCQAESDVHLEPTLKWLWWLIAHSVSAHGDTYELFNLDASDIPSGSCWVKEVFKQ